MTTYRRGLASLIGLALAMGMANAAPAAGAATGRSAPVVMAAPTYAVSFVSTAAFGVDMNDAGDVTGTSYRDIGCGSQCLPPLDTVVWRGGERIVLPEVPGLTGITVRSINNDGWVAGFAGFPNTTTHAVVWKPAGASYQAIDLGTLPGTAASEAVGIDDSGRVVGWSTTLNFPPQGSPFLWTEAGGMVDLSAQGFPDEKPIALSPGGTVAVADAWYRLGDPASVTPLASPPPGFGVDSAVRAINDAGDQAAFLVDTGPENLVYPFRYHHQGTWQQISTTPTGHLSSYGAGSINGAKTITATVGGTGVIAQGPSGGAVPLAGLISPAYQQAGVTFGGPMDARGRILTQLMIGNSPRLVRLAPAPACGAACIRVASIDMVGTGPPVCNQGMDQVTARLLVTDESGSPLAGVRVSGHLMDDYWTDKLVAAQTNAQGIALIRYQGPPCVGAVALLVTGASSPGRTLDRTAGQLTDFVIPQ